ncbi:MAG: glycosyltransferase family 1 protein [Patescibacteria group bacterium]
MRIGIDARLYGEEKNRGLGRYIKELIHHLEKVNTEDDFFIFLTKENYDEYHPSSPRFQKRLWDVRWYTAKEQLLPCPMDRERLDLIHFPHWNVPLFVRTPFIVTIHDLILIESNRRRDASTLGVLKYAIKYASFRITLWHALFGSRHILAISETVKQSLRRHFPILPPQKIGMIYQGMGVPDQPAVVQHTNDARVRPPYLLYVGGAYPHKNLSFLLRSFARLREIAPQTPYQLILAGKKDFFYERVERQAMKKEGLARLIKDGSILFFGRATQAELGALYRGASLLVTASLAEGMGFPPLEAMMVGTSIAVSDLPIFREILGAAPSYFNPSDVENCVKTLLSALTNPLPRDTIREYARTLQKKYAWKLCAAQTLAVYHQIATTRR